MNEFDKARLERKSRRIVSDPNRASGEGPTRNPAHCHDYGPRERLHTPERAAAIRAAVDLYGERLNGGQLVQE